MTLRKAAATLAGAVVLAFPGAALAQMKPATGEQVSEAVQECVAITSPTWIDLAKLKEDGWATAEKSSGRRMMKIRGAYQKRGNDAYIVAGRDELKAKQCVVVTRLEATSAYNTLAQAVSNDLGMPSGQDGFAYIWTTGNTTIRMEPAGDRKAPNAQFTVSAAKDESE